MTRRTPVSPAPSPAPSLRRGSKGTGPSLPAHHHRPARPASPRGERIAPACIWNHQEVQEPGHAPPTAAWPGLHGLSPIPGGAEASPCTLPASGSRPACPCLAWTLPLKLRTLLWAPSTHTTASLPQPQPAVSTVTCSPLPQAWRGVEGHAGGLGLREEGAGKPVFSKRVKGGQDHEPPTGQGRAQAQPPLKVRPAWG